MPTNGSGQRMVEQRQHWLFRGFDLGHVITIAAMAVTAIWGAGQITSEFRTEIAVIKVQILRLA